MVNISADIGMPGKLCEETPKIPKDAELSSDHIQMSSDIKSSNKEFHNNITGVTLTQSCAEILSPIASVTPLEAVQGNILQNMENVCSITLATAYSPHCTDLNVGNIEKRTDRQQCVDYSDSDNVTYPTDIRAPTQAYTRDTNLTEYYFPTHGYGQVHPAGAPELYSHGSWLAGHSGQFLNGITMQQPHQGSK
jgi:hypothetical protein